MRSSDIKDGSIRNVQADSRSETTKGANGRGPSGGHSVRDAWDYLEVLGKPMCALVGALAVALIGWFGQKALEHQQNARVFAELMSQREQAEAGIRKDMFATVLRQFFDNPEANGGEISKRLLQLEILALNFGETMSLSPLFLELDRDLEEAVGAQGPALGGWVPDTMPGRVAQEYRQRLRSLAHRVSQWQLSRLSVGGEVWSIEVPISSVLHGGRFSWPDNAVDQDYGELPDSLRRAEIDSMGWKGFGSVRRNYWIEFSEADTIRWSIHATVTIYSEDLNLTETVREFDLTFFDFPMIDNVRLSHDQRFALVLEDFDDEYVKLAAVWFPGAYSSQRDQPFLDDVVSRLASDSW